MFVPVKVSLTFYSHDHIWKVRWQEDTTFKNSNSLHVTLIKTMPTVKEPSDANSVEWIC